MTSFLSFMLSPFVMSLLLLEVALVPLLVSCCSRNMNIVYLLVAINVTENEECKDKGNRYQAGFDAASRGE